MWRAIIQSIESSGRWVSADTDTDTTGVVGGYGVQKPFSFTQGALYSLFFSRQKSSTVVLFN